MARCPIHPRLSSGNANMRWGRVRNNDNLFRHCIHPVSFRGPRFAPEKLIKIYDEPDGSLLASLAWERFVPNAELLHGYGCRVALRINDKARAEGRYKESRRHIYCGGYQLRADSVRALTNDLSEIAFADVVHHIEDGEIAHADLIIVLKVADGLDIENTKTAILDRLWNSNRGPLKHICNCDKEIAPHPSLSLPTAPCGGYSDNRSHILRLWFIIRYRVYHWLWKEFFRSRS